MMRLAAIVQARMGSHRFPGKVLKPLGGVPMLWHTFQRLRRVREIDQIILATSELKQDDPLVDFADEEQIPVFRGSEEDVLERYYLAAKKFDTDVIIRITGDCPFIDPEITRRTIRLFLENHLDYSSNTLERTFPRGTDTEVFSFEALERAYLDGIRPEDREHVTYFIRTHPERFKVQGIKNGKDLSFIRHCVDEERDYLFVKALFHHLAFYNIFFNTRDVEWAIDKFPWLKEINRDVRQKPI